MARRYKWKSADSIGNMITVRVSTPRKRKRKDPVFVHVRIPQIRHNKLLTLGQARDIPSKERDARQQNNQGETYESRQGYQVGLGMSTQSQELIVDLQKPISRSFKNNGECCMMCWPKQQGLRRARLRSRCPYNTGQPVPTGHYE